MTLRLGNNSEITNREIALCGSLSLVLLVAAIAGLEASLLACMNHALAGTPLALAAISVGPVPGTLPLFAACAIAAGAFTIGYAIIAALRIARTIQRLPITPRRLAA